MDIISPSPSPHHKTKPAKEEEIEEEDESLSLRDFPLTWDEGRRDSSKFQDKRRSSSEPSDFFEFFSSSTSQMSNAEDIIFCGKLFHHQILKSLSADDATHLSRRCCGDSARPCSTLTNKRLSRHYRSMDCKRARRRDSNLLSTMKPPAAEASCAKSEGPGLRVVSKPRWFVMMFGPLKLQPEMDLRDMKNRQVRRSPGSLFPGGGKPASRRSFWGHDLLRVLSCKTHASVPVTASIGFMPTHF